MGVGPQQIGGGHDHARCAVAALQGVLGLEGILQRVPFPVREPLDGGDLGAVRPAPPARRSSSRTRRSCARCMRRSWMYRSRRGCRSCRLFPLGNGRAAAGAPPHLSI
jgi:hypothetical protein